MKEEFTIEGNGKVQRVGFRPLLTSVGYLDYQVKVYASNVPGQNKIRVLVEGEQDAILRFINDVKDKKIKPDDMKETDYEVKRTDREVINNHIFLEHASALQLDQMGTFVSEAKKIRTEMAGMRGDMSGVRKDITIMTGTITELPKHMKKALKEK
jgi:Hydrogenase maturation factor